LKQPIPIEHERKKRRRELYVATAAAVFIGVIFLTEAQIARSMEDIPFAGHLLLFGLLTVVTLLLILVFFFLIRNLFKLVFERRGRVPGAKLKTRLTVAFVALTLIPTVVLFIASAGILHTTIESWFRTQVEDALQSSLVVAQAYYQTASEKVLTSASRVAARAASRPGSTPSESEAFQHDLDSWRTADGLSSVQIYYKDASPPLLSKDSALKDVPIPPPVPSFLKIGFQGERTSQIISLDGGSDLIRAIAPVRDRDDEPVRSVVVTDYYIPNSLAARLQEITNVFVTYQEARRMKGPVKTIYVLVLLVVALVVIFIGFWFGMTMARDITDPILSLVEGTDNIASGDLDVYIEPVGDDELAVLARSFNKMAADLRTGRDELVRVNIDLDSRRKYMETVLKNVAAGVLALDPQRKITTINSPARRLLGIREEDIIGKPLMDVLPNVSASAMKELLEDLEEAGYVAIERQMKLSFPDRAYTLLCFANSLREEEGGKFGVVLVFEDMTYLVKAQRMAAWREVARRIAHEIKNPLTPIQLNAQRIRRKYMEGLGPDAEVLDLCTRTIIDQVEQLKNMVNEFSKFARMPTAKPLPNDLNALIREVVDLYREGNNGTSISFQEDAAIPVFDLDKEQMKRVMVNLLDNAVTAAGPEGYVKIQTKYDTDLSIVSISVADSGPGIDPEDRDRLFEPYFSRRPGGTGLGLTIVSTIVSDHNGFVRVKENQGGAEFVVELPVRNR